MSRRDRSFSASDLATLVVRHAAGLIIADNRQHEHIVNIAHAYIGSFVDACELPPAEGQRVFRLLQLALNVQTGGGASWVAMAAAKNAFTEGTRVSIRMLPPEPKRARKRKARGARS